MEGLSLRLAAQCCGDAAAGVSLWEGDVCLLPPEKAPSPTMWHLGSQPAILSMTNWEALCQAAEDTTRDEIQQWKSPPGPIPSLPSLAPPFPHPVPPPFPPAPCPRRAYWLPALLKRCTSTSFIVVWCWMSNAPEPTHIHVLPVVWPEAGKGKWDTVCFSYKGDLLWPCNATEALHKNGTMLKISRHM